MIELSMVAEPNGIGFVHVGWSAAGMSEPGCPYHPALLRIAGVARIVTDGFVERDRGLRVLR